MWFLSARKARRTLTPRAPRDIFRPRLEALEDRCLMSAGALDPNFGSGGLVTGPTPAFKGTDSDHPTVVAQADGKIVAGTYVVGSNGYRNFAVVRYNSDGSLDTSFGPNHTGIASTAMGARDSWINGLALDSSGRIVAVGHAVTQAKSNSHYVAFAAARYTSAGGLDSTFGSGGIVLTNFAPVNGYTNQGLGATSVVIQSDGKIDVAGTAQTVTVTGKGANATTTVATDFALVRYNSSGSLDTGFGSGGIVVTPQFGAGADYGNALTLQADGKIVVVGYAGPAMAVVRYTATGQLDSTFNDNGIVTLPNLGANTIGHGVIVQSSGKIVVAGITFFGPTDDAAATLARLGVDGRLDTSFGSAGTGLVIDNKVGNITTSAWDLVQDPNGDLLTCGTFAADYTNVSTFDMLVEAYLPDGAPDTTFGSNGATTAGFSGVQDKGRRLAVQGDGKLVAVGFTLPAGSTTPTIELARFQPPNTKINSFTAGPTSFAAGTLVTLTVSGILNSNPSSTIDHLVFYLDSTGSSPLTTVAFVSNSNGTWTYSFDTSGLAAGADTVYVEAVDGSNVLSDPAVVSLQVTV